MLKIMTNILKGNLYLDEFVRLKYEGVIVTFFDLSKLRFGLIGLYIYIKKCKLGEYGFDVKEIDIVTLCCCLADCGPEFIIGHLYWYPT